MKSLVKIGPKLLLLAFSLLFLASACSGDSSPDDAVNDSESENSETEEVDESGSAASVEQASLNPDWFIAEALTEDPQEVDCELTDGTATTCWEITVAGYPADHDTGPFCPTKLSDGADAGGVWFIEGEAIYDVDGEFVENLAELYRDDTWKMYDDEGNILVNSEEQFALVANPQPSEELANYCVEGKLEYLENGEPIPSTFLIPTTPVVADQSSSGSQWGVTVNGVVIDPSAPVSNIISNYNIAPLDDCGGHYNPATGYHMHAALDCSTSELKGHEGFFGVALDGFPIFAYDEELTDLDECNGHTVDEVGYHYHASAPEDNSVLQCWMGTVESSNSAGNAGGPPGNGPPGDGGPPGGGPPQ